MTMSALLFSDGGAGKSYVAATAPGPIIVAETEGRQHLYPRGWEYWDPATGVFPKVTAESISVVPIGSRADMTQLMGALSVPDAPWVTVLIDSFSVLAKIGEHELVKDDAKDARQEYKKLLKWLEQDVLIPLKNITSRSDTKAEVLVATAWQDAEIAAPYITGGIKISANHLFDIVGQVAITFENGKIGQAMRIMPTRGVKVKAPGWMYYKYGEAVINPNLSLLNSENGTPQTGEK